MTLLVRPDTYPALWLLLGGPNGLGVTAADCQRARDECVKRYGHAPGDDWAKTLQPWACSELARLLGSERTAWREIGEAEATRC